MSFIAKGGMGEVYRAQDTRLNRSVALKVLAPSFTTDAEGLARFTQEARTTALLNHPNIVSVYDVGVHDGVPFVVSELLEGKTLRARMRNGALSVRAAVSYGLEITQGLIAAHDLGVVHRDLKPENIFITRENRVKILDFGLAKCRNQTLGSAASGLVEVHASRPAARDRRLHVAGTGTGRANRPSIRHLQPRRDAARDDHRRSRRFEATRRWRRSTRF